MRAQLKTLRETLRAGKKMDTKAMKGFLREQEDFLAHMNREIVHEGLVTKGSIDDSHLFSEFGKGKEKRKRVA